MEAQKGFGISWRFREVFYEETRPELNLEESLVLSARCRRKKQHSGHRRLCGKEYGGLGQPKDYSQVEHRG